MLLSTVNVLQRVLGVHTSRDSKNPWKPPKGPHRQAHPDSRGGKRGAGLLQTSARHGTRTFRDRKGTGHYMTAFTTLDKAYFHANSNLFIYCSTVGKFCLVVFCFFFFNFHYLNECHIEHRQTMGSPPPDTSQVPADMRGRGQQTSD